MSADAAIVVENLSKSYLIGHERTSGTGYHTLRETMMLGLRSFARKTTDMARGRQVVQGDEVEQFWALKDVSFEMKRGEVLGIIGRNGAGKSTLLKVLSRITEPTEGRVRIRGRVASLLEVGTGFHPELTGRENIFLNGAVLGMTRAEIKQRFDEIVDFAGVERFLDTPVKRYSSGMYVRLAFAVAAHLESEILVIDEVLAVGDAEFQKKCLGKMQDVASGGRTVLFVSHSMAMISSLCDTAIQLVDGNMRRSGTASEVAFSYLSDGENSAASVDYRRSPSAVGDEFARPLAADVRNSDGERVYEIRVNEASIIRMEYEIRSNSRRIYHPNFHFYREDGTCAFVTGDSVGTEGAVGQYCAECSIPADLLNDGAYSVGLALTSYDMGVCVHFFEKGAIVFRVRDPIAGVRTRGKYAGAIPGAVRPLLHWTTERTS